MKECQQMTVRVQGSAHSAQRAFANALTGVQQEILKQNSNIILRIEPVDVEIISTTKKTITEKFLFFFFPRQKSTFNVELDVIVDVTFVDLSQIEFTSN